MDSSLRILSTVFSGILDDQNEEPEQVGTTAVLPLVKLLTSACGYLGAQLHNITANLGRRDPALK
jgi:hypothetical protein